MEINSEKWSGNENLNSITNIFFLSASLLYSSKWKKWQIEGSGKAQQDIEQNDNSFPTDTFCTINSL